MEEGEEKKRKRRNKNKWIKKKKKKKRIADNGLRGYQDEQMVFRQFTIRSNRTSSPCPFPNRGPACLVHEFFQVSLLPSRGPCFEELTRNSNHVNFFQHGALLCSIILGVLFPPSDRLRLTHDFTILIGIIIIQQSSFLFRMDIGILFLLYQKFNFIFSISWNFLVSILQFDLTRFFLSGSV